MNTSQYDYDLIVLGGGSGGLAMAQRAAEHYGKRCLAVERNALGGTCVNVGCVPKKVMWLAAQLSHTLDLAPDYGFDIQRGKLDWARLIAGRQRYIAHLQQHYANRLNDLGIAQVRGRGAFVGSHSVAVDGRRYTAEHLLIATGGQPVRLPLPGGDLGITSDGFFELDQLPTSALIVGGGYIGLELAGVLNALGSRVTLAMRSYEQDFLPGFADLLRETQRDELQQAGIQVHFGGDLATAEHDAAAGGYRLTFKNSAATDFHDTLLWAVGRAPNTGDLGLDAIGVATDARGFVTVDADQTTTAPHIFAVGDCTDRIPLTPVAIAAARRLADRLYGDRPDSRLDYHNIPTVMFTHPPMGAVGLTADQARARYGDDAVTVYANRFSPMRYALSAHRVNTAMQLVVVGETQRVVGVHLVGDNVDEMLQGFAVALKLGATKRDFDNTVAIHPTSAEELVTLR